MNLVISLLMSAQGQSVLRSLLKMGGTLLIARGAADPTSLDAIIGGIMATIGIIHSVGTHAPDASIPPAKNTPAPSEDIIDG
jgi:hypothetical protein